MEVATRTASVTSCWQRKPTETYRALISLQKHFIFFFFVGGWFLLLVMVVFFFFAFCHMNICDNFLTRQTLSIKKVKNASVASGIAENGSEQEAELISQGGLMCAAQMLGKKEHSDGWMVVKQQKRETCIRATDFHLYVT